MSQDRIASLVAAATSAANAGRWEQAEQLWSQVRGLDPQHVQALFSLGVHAYRNGDSASALHLLETAKAASPGDPMLPLTISVVHRDAGNLQSEWDAIVNALAIDPYFLPGLLSKGEFLQRGRKSRAAAAVFRDVLKVAPPEPQWPPALRRRLGQARAAVQRDTDELQAYLHHQLSAQRAAVEAAVGDRWDEAVAILAGQSRPYRSECNRLHVPRLPAQPFYEVSRFPWIPAVEARTGAIQAELAELISHHLGRFTPYVAYQPGDPVNQWGPLNHSRDWSSYHLWAHGAPVQENLDRCPQTAAALAEVEAVEIAGLCPNAMFSALAPGTVIPPHSGETNARLVAHLPLLVPPDCAFRVGYDRRAWEEGKIFVFDDTIEHEARNDSGQLRVVLIFDVWNPLLSKAEREMVQMLSKAMRDYRASPD